MPDDTTMLHQMREDIETVKAEVEKLRTALQGDPDIAYIGIFTQIAAINTQMIAMNTRLQKQEDDKKAQVWMVRGAALMLGVSSVSGLSAIAAFLGKIFGGG